MPNYDYRRLQPADQLVYDTRGNLVGIRAGTSGDQAIFGLNEAEYPAVQALVSGDANSVVVFGATPGGFGAAIAAARQNKRVFLLSDSDRIGGMQGWGITQTDFEVNSTAGTCTGLPKEFWSRVGKNETIGRVTFQRFHRGSGPGFPSWFTRVFDEMVAEHRQISVIYNCHTPTVDKSGTVINSITVQTPSGAQTLRGGVFVDASYTGDLAAVAGCTVAIGRESTALYSEALAGIRSPTLYTSGAVDPYVNAGTGTGPLLPFVDSAVGTVGSGDGRVMTWNYRMFVTTNSGDRVPFPAPDMARYTAAVAAGHFEVLARAMAVQPAAFDTLAEIFPNIYPNAVASGYFDWNGNVGVSTNYPGYAELVEYITASHARRLEIRGNVKQWILGLLYWIRYSGDVRIPAALVTEIANYGLCASELKKYGNGFVELYVREGRRIVGDFVMRQANVTVGNGYTDFIGFLMYGYDTSQVRLVNDGGAVKSEGSNLTALPAGQLGAKIPYRVLLPKATEVTNLLCVGCPSVSQVVWRTMRLEPTLMQMGQAAGIAAALAIEQGVTVHNISTARLKKIQDLYETAGAIVCCVDPAFGGEVNPTYTPDAAAWTSDSSRFGFIATFARTDGNTSKGSKSIRFNFILYETGAYEVFFRYPAQPGNTEGNTGPSNVPVTINHADGASTRVVNMRYPGGNGGTWESLGVFTFRDKGSGAVSDDNVLVETTGTSGAVVADSVKLVKVSN